MIKTSCKRTNFIFNHILPQLETQNTSYHKLTGFREENRDIEKLAMLRKAQFSKKLRFSIINLRMKKLHKQDEFGIEG